MKSYQQLSLNIIFVFILTFLLIQSVFFKSKTGYIDSNKVLNGYNQISAAKKDFQKKVELYKERLDTLSGRVKLDLLNMEKFRNDKFSFQRYSDSANFHKKQYRDYQQAISESLKDEEAKLMQAAVVKLNEFLKEYGKKEGYDIIFIASNAGTIAYAKDQYDITDKVLKEINK